MTVVVLSEFMKFRRCLRLSGLILAAGVVFTSHSAEYEVHGVIHQVITDYNVAKEETTNEFSVYVRDCGWLIETKEYGKKGQSWLRQVGSTAGAEIYESNAGQAFISESKIPVELLDVGVDAHLWLMFASQCYWTNLHTDQLTPVFDWHASIGANPNLKVGAEWELLNGPGSLPREVRYLGKWDETNGLYKIKGTNTVGNLLIPNGFIFEERYATREGMVLRKRVEADVISIEPVCSRKNFSPTRESQRTVIVDWRLSDSGKNPAGYAIGDTQKWPSIEEAREIVRVNKSNGEPFHKNPLKQSESKQNLVLAIMCICILVPPLIYVLRKKRADS